MRKFIFFLLVLAVIMFITKPEREQYYDKVLTTETGMGSEHFATLKYAAVELAYTYENYYVGGVLRSKVDEKVKYVGLFTVVIKIPSTE